jgi:hypothetical protein
MRPHWKGLDQDTKYGNTPNRCHQGSLHHSKLESRRCDELHVLQSGGEIRDLKAHPQPAYPLTVNGFHVAVYQADFEYVDRDGNLVTEDTKGFITDVYRLKSKLFEALMGRQIREVRGTRRVGQGRRR